MYSPGYVEENRTKPKITLKIEESDEGLKPEQAAEALLRGSRRLFNNLLSFDALPARHSEWKLPYRR